MYSGRFLMESMKIRFAKSETMHYIFPWLHRWTNERSVADWAIYKSSCKTYFQQSSALKRQIKADNEDADGIQSFGRILFAFVIWYWRTMGRVQQGASFFCCGIKFQGWRQKWIFNIQYKGDFHARQEKYTIWMFEDFSQFKLVKNWAFSRHQNGNLSWRNIMKPE